MALTDGAYAGWRDTEWGMTVAEMQKLHPNATEGSRFGSFNLEEGDAEYADSFIENGLHYDVSFLFTGDSLVRVVLDLKEYTHCRQIRDEYAIKLGDPDESRLFGVGATWHWYRSDEIMVSEFRDRPSDPPTVCRILYRPGQRGTS